MLHHLIRFRAPSLREGRGMTADGVSPPHQLLGFLLVVLEELLVGLALDHQRLEAQLLSLLLVVARGERLLQRGHEYGLDVAWQIGGRRDAARHRPDLVETLLLEGW